jgi:hypothetical protein
MPLLLLQPPQLVRATAVGTACPVQSEIKHLISGYTALLLNHDRTLTGQTVGCVTSCRSLQIQTPACQCPSLVTLQGNSIWLLFEWHSSSYLWQICASWHEAIFSARVRHGRHDIKSTPGICRVSLANCEPCQLPACTALHCALSCLPALVDQPTRASPSSVTLTCRLIKGEAGSSNT